MTRNYNGQLKNLATNSMIARAGGFVYVAAAGTTAKLALTDKDGAALANPLALTNGSFDFNVPDTTAAVDLFIQSPTGHFVVLTNVKPSGDASVFVDASQLQTTMVIPFNVDDQTGDNTETRCGFTQTGAVQPNVSVQVLTVDATETVNFGTLSTDSGDADGYVVGVSVATAGYIKATGVNGATTLGALLIVQDSANSGDKFPEQNTSQIGKEFTYTLSAGADTAAGYFVVPVQLPVTSL
jgi:hypothetical protein